MSLFVYQYAFLRFHSKQGRVFFTKGNTKLLGVVCSLKQDTEGKFDFKIDVVLHANCAKRKKNEFMEVLKMLIMK